MMKAVIFDLDGVIVVTDHLHYLAWKKMADDEQIYFDEIINNRLRGISRMASLDIILERANRTYSNEEKERLATKKNNIYVGLLEKLNKNAILPGVLEIVDKLKEKGVKIAIGSSSKNAPIILKQIGLQNAFDAIADGNDITHSKPNPEVFLKAAKRLNINPKDCVVVEDAEAGIEAAKKASMVAFAVGDAKKSPLADYRSDDLKEILSLFN